MLSTNYFTLSLTIHKVSLDSGYNIRGNASSVVFYVHFRSSKLRSFTLFRLLYRSQRKNKSKGVRSEHLDAENWRPRCDHSINPSCQSIDLQKFSLHISALLLRSAAELHPVGTNVFT